MCEVHDMHPIAAIGARAIHQVDAFGDFCRFTGRTLAWVAEGMSRWRNLRLLFPQFYEIGTRSVPVVMVTGAFVGMVLAVQMVAQFKAAGLTGRMGTIVNLSVLRELGPVLAGVMLAATYGVAHFYMGFLPGLKAFTAAVLGGIGNIPGAMLGGIIIGLIETFWSAYFSIQYKDVAAFSMLALVLIFFPSGLLGRPEVEKV
jgi:hypothetical protein